VSLFLTLTCAPPVTVIGAPKFMSAMVIVAAVDAAGKFDMDVDGKEQGSFTAPTEPGEYAFHCNYHPSMHGTLIVK